VAGDVVHRVVGHFRAAAGINPVAVGLVTGVKSPMEEADRRLDKGASTWLSTTSTADHRPRTERRT
jgi:hypothetical protein